MPPVAAVFGISVIVISLALFVKPHFCNDSKTRRLLLMLPILFLSILGYLVASPVTPGLFSFLIPYEQLGVWPTTDLDGNPCSVRVDAKAMSCRIPPGELPRIRLESTTSGAGAVYVCDTGWRFGVGAVRPVKGGLEIFSSPLNRWGLRFRLRRNEWSQETIVPDGW